MTARRVLVYCANGFQGHAITLALVASGCFVRALVRDKDKAAPLAQAGAEVHRADLNDVASLRRAHDDVDVAVVQLPSGLPPDATRAQGTSALKAIANAGINKIVLNASVHYPRRSDELPQFAARHDVEREFLQSGRQVSVVHAPFLLSNLQLPWASHSIANQGVLSYPVTADVALCWTAPDDLGRLIALVIEYDLYGSALNAGARAAMRGSELAAAFSEALQRRITYSPTPLDAFEAGVDAAIAPGVGKQVGAIFRFIERHPDDRAFVSMPFATPTYFPPFEPMTVTEWVTANVNAFSPVGAR
jgi:NAD(P)H dehydrogenase (quinone)